MPFFIMQVSASLQVVAPQELFKLWRAGKVPLLFVAYSWMLSQVADALGVTPGEEFRVALLEAQQVCSLQQVVQAKSLFHSGMHTRISCYARASTGTGI